MLSRTASGTPFLVIATASLEPSIFLIISRNELFALVLTGCRHFILNIIHFEIILVTIYNDYNEFVKPQQPGPFFKYVLRFCHFAVRLIPCTYVLSSSIRK